MQQFIYPAIFYLDDEETKVYFPDLDISTSGENYDDAFLFAKGLLKAYFMYILAHDLDFNFPSSFEDVSAKCGKHEVPLLIDAIISPEDMKDFKKTGKVR